MYISADNKSRDLAMPVDNIDLTVIAAGHLSPLSDVFHERPAGFPNYMMIFIKSGSGSFRFSGETVEAHTDDLILYRPNEPQIFTYFKKEAPHIYWIHFAGTQADALMQHFGLRDLHSLHFPNDFIPKAISTILAELNNNRTFCEEVTHSLLLNMLARIARETIHKRPVSRVEEITSFMWQTYMEDTPVNVYAERCGLSVPHFMRLFKSAFGTTPLDYKLQIRIHMAKEILLTTQCEVREVALMVGFKDPFHFSRHFKKRTGYSPSEYRQMMSHQPMEKWEIQPK